MATQTAPVSAEITDTFPINGTDYVEFYVGNAKQAAQYYQSAFGHQIAAYRGPETGVRDRVSYVLIQNKIRLVLTSPLGPDGEVADHVRLHGDGVRDLALWVDDARDAYEKAIERGAQPAYEPRLMHDTDGDVIAAGIRIYGDTIHSLVERRNYRGPFLPAFCSGRHAIRRWKPASFTSITALATWSSANECVGRVLRKSDGL